ncbi:MAG: hypothetical protein ABL919_01415 [Methylococcales bacterium]|nr:hypothetical protein [Methylococcaceae bacterium]
MSCSTSSDTISIEQSCIELNESCHCTYVDNDSVIDNLNQSEGTAEFRELLAQRPHLFADAAIFVPSHILRKQEEIISAIEQVIALPAYQNQVLSHAPHSAQFIPKTKGVFFGYDFHLSPDGPKLIEINSNAAGALLCSTALTEQKYCKHCVGISTANETKIEADKLFLNMFQDEWQSERGSIPLNRIAIVDKDPLEQYMLPEFLLFKHLFERHGIEAIICAPSELIHQHGKIWHGQKAIDLIYNRLTDFGLENEENAHLYNAYLEEAVVITPNPRNHALYADKRNLEVLTDQSTLIKLGIDEPTRIKLLEGIAHTFTVNSQDADRLWKNRKQLFFKPAKGFGSKAAYRGDKITLRVFDEILHNEYVAQSLIAPSKRFFIKNNELSEFKYDLRMYVYQGKKQMTVARLYQGQTTNFRTIGGGFAPVISVLNSFAEIKGDGD